ncbi:hypothetical protein [Rhodanobacter sp. UC4451_H18]
MIRRKIKYKEGDVFFIPSSKEGFYVGQIAVDTTGEIGAPFCYIFDGNVPNDYACEAIALDSSRVISANLITPELLKYGVWKICENRPVPAHIAMRDLKRARENGFVGSSIIGAGLATKYLDTFYGVMDLNHWPDPSFVQKFFLISLPHLP